MTTALLILRLVIGGLFAGHGAQKLFGWFGGHGPRNTGGFFESIGFRPGTPFAVLAGAAELTGGLLLAAGLLTPVAALLFAAVLASAIAAVVIGALGGLPSRLPGRRRPAPREQHLREAA
jgi:putative oxidoreductase